MLSFALRHQNAFRALVMRNRRHGDVNTLDAAERKGVEVGSAHKGIQAELTKRAIHPAAGERMAREQPAWNLIIAEMTASAAASTRALRANMAARTRPAAD